ncbi:hypothetical protein N7527_001463 [Penicillium freii]|nr:hypothetical protein N7527_001463 [Penicillium freii]
MTRQYASSVSVGPRPCDSEPTSQNETGQNEPRQGEANQTVKMSTSQLTSQLYNNPQLHTRDIKDPLPTPPSRALACATTLSTDPVKLQETSNQPQHPAEGEATAPDMAHLLTSPLDAAVPRTNRPNTRHLHPKYLELQQ